MSPDYEPSRPRSRLLLAGGAALVSLYFLILARAAFRAWFSPDDLMNLHRAWEPPAILLVKGNLLFFRVFPFYRPLASAWYRVMYHFAGFHPLPFHLVYLAVFLVNLFLTYSLVRRLSGSREVGAVVTLLGAYHYRMDFLFLDTSYVYDALCYTFYVSALLLYVRARQDHQRLRAGELAACCVLYIAALNSKEMAVTLPVVLVLYELLFQPPRSWDKRAIVATGLITLVYVIGILTDKNSLTSNPFYKPVFTAGQFMKTSRHFMGEVFSDGHDWTSPAVLGVWGLLLAIAAVCRSRVVWFAWLFLMLTPLPVAFLFPRGPGQYYIPWFGWTLFAGALLMEGVRRLTPRADPQVRGTAAMLGLALVLFPYEASQGWANAASITVEAPRIRHLSEQLHMLYPQLPPRSSLFFLNDPLPADRYDLLFLVRLSYRDRSLLAQRAKQIPPDLLKPLEAYDHVLDYQGGQLYELQAPWRRGEVPLIVQLPDGPEFYHQGFRPLNAASPAEPGELVIMKAMNLGATDPPAAEGQIFPRDPLARVTAPVEVKVNGRPAEVVTQIGWPDTVNTYRVDFTVPAATARGSSRIEISAGGANGPPVFLPVGQGRALP